MNPVLQQAAAVLIDADNVSPAGVEAAFAHLLAQGRQLTLKRAYGGHEKLAGLRECLLRHAVRGFVNQGKGTTDALLVVDAMDLLHADALPAAVAIVSSDADFAPLAVRLREAGIRVTCYAQSAKAADGELAKCYDELVYVDGVASPAAVPAPAAAKAARKAPARKRAAAPPPEPADPVREVLESLEGFRAGRSVELNEAVKRLRDARLMGKNASGPAFLKKHAPYAELTPTQQPNKLRLRA